MRSPLATEALFQLGPVPISAPVLTTWGIMAVLAFCAWRVTRHLQIERPGRMQALLEWVVEFIDGQIRGTMRQEPGPYRPLIGTIFLYILFANLSSLIPGVEAPTASLETDAALAGIVFAAVIYFGVRQRGLGGYLRSFAEPTWIMIPLNLVEQLTRTFSLMVRLFGNIMAGVFVIGIVLSLAGLLVPIPFMALDALTGIVQAYIFAVLAMVFIGAAASEGRDATSDQSNQEQA